MMKFFTLILMSTLVFSNLQAKEKTPLEISANFEDMGDMVLMLGMTTYKPVEISRAIALNLSLLSSTEQTIEDKEAVRRAINNDVQEFYVNGNLTSTLSQLIKAVKENTNLSETESLDLIVNTVNE